MANELAGVLTDLGAYLIEQAYQAGEVVQITEMALGDGGGSEVVVSPDVTGLVGEFHRQLLDNGPDEDSALGGSINYIPLPEHAGKWLREFGLFDSLGNLIVYAASSPAQLPENPNMAVQFIIGLMVPIMNIEAIEIVINPEGVLTNEDLREHEQSRNHPAAIEGAQGMIPLATQAMVDEGTDHASAVTPKTAGETFARQQHEHELDDILWLQEALDEKLNKAGDTATGNLTAPKFIMNAAQGTEAGDAVRYDYLLGAIPKRAILVSGHLDNYTNAGFYLQSATTPDPNGNLGYPVNKPGALLVLNNGGGLTQIYIVNPTTSTSNRAIYYRSYWIGSWSATWTKLYDTNNKPTPADIGAAPIDHGHEIADVNGLQGALDGKSPIGHTHVPGDVGAAPIDHVHTAAQGNADVVAGGYGQVGSYVLAWNSDGQSVFIGNTKSGSVLIPATAGERREDGHSLSGTYKCMGHVFGSGISDDATTLWMRTDAPSLFERSLTLSGLVWDNAEHDSATAIVTFTDSSISLPFTAFKDDVEAHGRWLFAMIRDGEFGSVAEYIPPTQQEIAASKNPALRQKEMAHATAMAQHYSMLGDQQLTSDWCGYYRLVYEMAQDPQWPMVSAWPIRPA